MNYLEQEVLCEQRNNHYYCAETLELERMFLVAKNLNAKLQKNGDQWCYQSEYGNLSDCITGVGDTPENALRDFYNQWKRI